MSIIIYQRRKLIDMITIGHRMEMLVSIISATLVLSVLLPRIFKIHWGKLKTLLDLQPVRIKLPLRLPQRLVIKVKAVKKQRKPQTQNQSAVLRANLTSASFEPVIGSLLAGRQAILNNNSESAYGSINAAGSQLFQLSNTAAGDNEDSAKQLASQFKPVHNSLDFARDALRDSNRTQALKGLNAADNNLLIIVQQLPTAEVDDEGSPEEQD